MARKQGPLIAFAKKAGQERITLKKITCENADCGRPLAIYADKQGWPYTICDSSDGCDHENKPHSMTSAKPLLSRDGQWNPRIKADIDTALVDYLKPQEEESEHDPFADFASEESPEDVAENVEPSTDTPEPKPKKEAFKLWS